MKLSISLLLPALAVLADAAAEPAKAYIFLPQKQLKTPPTLTPVEARLVVAQRLGISQFHQLDSADEATLDHINLFGGRPQKLFSNIEQDDTPIRMVLMVDGCPEDLLSSWRLTDVAFEISNPPSQAATTKLVTDLSAQISLSSSPSKNDCADLSFDPFHGGCSGSANARIRHVNIQSGGYTTKDLKTAADKLAGFVEDGALELMIILMPKSAATAKHSARPYGIYGMPGKAHKARSDDVEEPIADSRAPSEPVLDMPLDASSYDFRNISRGPIPFCYNTYNSCVAATGGCSGHGACYLKFNNTDPKTGNCYACGCVASYDSGLTTTWGGAACSKVDISAQFWLLAGFSIILMGLVAWAIGMMYSIGEEKLPGVIGAGVSGPKAR